MLLRGFLLTAISFVQNAQQENGIECQKNWPFNFLDASQTWTLATKLEKTKRLQIHREAILRCNLCQKEKAGQ